MGFLFHKYLAQQMALTDNDQPITSHDTYNVGKSENVNNEKLRYSVWVIGVI
jgi:hypothetical protein